MVIDAGPDDAVGFGRRRPMARDRFDLVVIGSGPAGEKGATQAAYHGKRVAVVDRNASPGGTAVATGGIPTKRCARRPFRSVLCAEERLTG